MREVVRAFRQRYCKHECHYMTDMHRRQDGEVECVCHKCGKMLVAPYGLALPAKLVVAPKESKE